LLLTKAMDLAKQLYKNIYELVVDVKAGLKAKGLVVPIKHSNGTIQIGKYIIVKNGGFYSVTHESNRVEYTKINLPHTAIIIANDLALGRWADTALLEYDRQYGFNLFEQQQLKHIADSMIKRNDWSRVDTLLIKHDAARTKADLARRSILMSYAKLRQLR